MRSSCCTSCKQTSKKIYCTVEILSAPQIYAKERTTEHTHHTHQKLSFRLCLHRGGGGGGGGIGESGVVGAGGGGGGGGGEPTSLVLPEREPPALYLKPPPPPPPSPPFQ